MDFFIKKYPVNFVIPFALCIPVFAVLGSALILHEHISWPIIIGGVITIMGVAIITIKLKIANLYVINLHIINNM
ncbi:MAG: EamA family transporter [Rickettsiales endosymbiont of Dermacentor nuttalli]